MKGRCGQGQKGWRGLGCGSRITAPREAIFQTLSSFPGHMSADEIFINVRAKLPGVGLATVYRNLELLKSGGYVSFIDSGDGKARYELNHAAGGEGHHHHIICRQCGNVINYMDFEKEEMELIKKLEKHLSQKYNYEITDHDIAFYGTCQKCSTKTAQTSAG